MYYDGKMKKFYDINMGPMIEKEYTTKFLELLTYVLYLKDEKEKIKRFVSGLPLAFTYHIEYDEPWSLEEFIDKVKQFYEQSKRKIEYQEGWKEKDKAKGEWNPNQTRPQDAGEKENGVRYKKFNVVRQGHGSHPRG